MTSTLLISLILLTGPSEHWPAFRGDGTSQTNAKNLPTTWSENEGVAWSTKLPGVGQSSPVVWGDQVFATSVLGDRKQKALVLAFDLQTGKKLWRHEFASAVPAPVNGYISQAAPTPAADADRIYAFFEVGNLVALDHQGNVAWERALTEDYGPFFGNHGVGSSVALTKNAVIVLVDHDGPSYLLAVDKASGKTLWKTDRPKQVAWSSPIVTTHQANERIVVSSNGSCSEFDAETGERLWSISGIDGNTVPSATVTGALVIVGSSEAGENIAVRRGGAINDDEDRIAWRSRDATATFSSPLVHDGHVYFVNRAGVAFCLDVDTGKTIWTHRIGDSCWASPLGAGDRVYFFCKDGTTTVVAAGNALKVLAKNEIPTDDRVYGIAAVDGKLVIRTESRLTCVGQAVKKEDAPVTNAQPVKQTANRYPDLPKAITSFGAAVLGESVYVYGGHHGRAHHYSEAGQSGDLLRLDLEKPEKWSVVSSGPKLQGLAVVPYDGILYRVGGFMAKNTEDEEQDLWSVADFASFDPTTGKWTELPDMPKARSSFDAVVLAGKLYVAGGWSMAGDEETEWHDMAYSFDLSKQSGKWQALPKQPFRRRAISVGTFDGKLYVIGGMQPNGKVTSQTAIFDPDTKDWSEGPSLPEGQLEGFGTAAISADGKLYVSTSSGNLLVLSSDGKKWELITKQSSGRFFHRMLPLGVHKLMLLGGANMNQGRFSSVEVVDLSPSSVD